MPLHMAVRSREGDRRGACHTPASHSGGERRQTILFLGSEVPRALDGDLRLAVEGHRSGERGIEGLRVHVLNLAAVLLRLQVGGHTATVGDVRLVLELVVELVVVADGVLGDGLDAVAEERGERDLRVLRRRLVLRRHLAVLALDLPRARRRHRRDAVVAVGNELERGAVLGVGGGGELKVVVVEVGLQLVVDVAVLASQGRLAQAALIRIPIILGAQSGVVVEEFEALAPLRLDVVDDTAAAIEVRRDDLDRARSREADADRPHWCH